MRPPREAKTHTGKVWLLTKSVYGLLDATRGFYLNFSESLQSLGMETCKMDPAMFLLFGDNSTDKSEKRNLTGMITTHVDDSLSAGNEQFKEQVEEGNLCWLMV